jgi:C1A family cysteine protease
MTPPTEFDGFGLGAIPSPPDANDFQLVLDTASTLPVRYKATLLGPVLNQGNTGRCVAFASTGIRQQEERAGGDWPAGWPPLDPQWLYDQAQKIDGIPLPHEGTTCRAALTVLLKQGQPLKGKPATAGSFKVKAYYAVPMDVASQKRAIMQYGPLLIATLWFNNQFRPVNGFLPAPKGGPVGGHARYRWGWDDTIESPSATHAGVWYDRNSWDGWPGSVNGNTRDAYEFDQSMQMHDCWKSADVLGD